MALEKHELPDLGVELRSEILREDDGKKMWTGFALVTPEMAQRWLEERAPNRHLKDKTMERYTADMRSNRWKITHQGIAFNSAGNLTDGQHRLNAIVKSGKPAWMPITIGIDDVIAVDTHRARFAADVITMQTGEHVSIRVTAMANAMVEFTRIDNWQQGMSHTLLAEFIAAHREGIVFTDHIFKVKAKLSPAPIMAVVARAYYHEDHDRLLEFANVLLSGHPNGPNDYPALKLRDYLLSGEAGFGDRGSRIAKYRRTEYALYHFCKGIELRHLRAAKGELYPLPTESDYEARRAEEAEVAWDNEEAVEAITPRITLRRGRVEALGVEEEKIAA